MSKPLKVIEVAGANGELLVVFPCLEHRTHVVVGGGLPGSTSAPLHLQVTEALELVDVLNAGEAWAKLGPRDEFRQASVAVRDGFYAVSINVQTGAYYVSWQVPGLPIVVVRLNDVGRGQLAAAVLELVHGKAAAA